MRKGEELIVGSRQLAVGLKKQYDNITIEQ
jgi:hypothetical protein